MDENMLKFPETAINIALDLVNGVSAHNVQKKYHLSDEKLKSIVYKYSPRFGSHLLAGKLTSEQQKVLLDFFQLIEKLFHLKRVSERGENLLIIKAQEDLQKLIKLELFHNSEFFRIIARNCLREWRECKERIIASRGGIEKSSYLLSEYEVILLLEILEHFANLLPDRPHKNSLPDFAKLQGHQFLVLGKPQMASQAFDRAVKYAHTQDKKAQKNYLLFFFNLSCYLAAWKELRLEEARIYHEKAVKLAQNMPERAFPQGFYCDLDDLRRDSLLVNSTEKALGGNVPEAIEFLAQWLGLSEEIKNITPHYHRIFVRKLALEFLKSEGIEASSLKSKIRSYLIGQNIGYRADLYCFYIVNSVNYGSLQTKEAAVLIAKLIPRDADIERDEVDKVKEIEAEFEIERQDLQFMPPWIVDWLQSDTTPQRQFYALQIYSCCIAEYYSGYFGLPKPSIFDGLDWAIKRIKILLNHSMRYREDFEQYLIELERIANIENAAKTEVFDLVKRSAGILFPHIVRQTYIVQANEKSPELVCFEREWAKEPKSLEFPTRNEEVWHDKLYYYINPRINFHSLSRLQRDPKESFDPVIATLYGKPNPNPIVLVVEGPTEEGLFTHLLDSLYPKWQALNIQIYSGKGAGGTYIQVIETINKQFPMADFFLVYDEDARKFIEKQRALLPHVGRILERSHHYVMNPDIEGISPKALLTAINNLWTSVNVSDPNILPTVESYVDKVKINPKLRNTSGTLIAARDIIRRTTSSQLRGVSFVKSKKWGEYLAEAMLQNDELPAEIGNVLEKILISARGLIVTNGMT